MTQISSDNKRVAVNTIFLYIRLLLTVAIGLFTSRIVLNTLGQSDFGIFGVVGGIVLMLGFLNNAMLQVSQRFISYAIGDKEHSNIDKVFATSYLTHLSIAAIVIVLAETVGLWFVTNKLNIPTERADAAFWVYQFAIATSVVSMISVPYNSCIIAHERMKVYAYISIFEAVAKLLIVYLLYVGHYDKLILYSCLLFIVQLIVRLLYTLYCRKHFSECRAKITYDKEIFSSMFRFAGWSILGNMGFAFRDQGSNIILNLFYNTILNAARTIAMQVNTIINQFASSFTLALNPQITKYYASGKVQHAMRLVYIGSRMSFYLLMIIAIPLLFHTDYILTVWLKNVPEHSATFVQFSLIAALLYAMSQPMTVAIQATGKIMFFQIAVCSILLLELPIAYILLNSGYQPYSIMIPTVVSNLIFVFLRLFIAKHYIKECDVKTYIINVFVRCCVVFALCSLVAEGIKNIISYDNFAMFCIVIICTEIACSQYFFCSWN